MDLLTTIVTKKSKVTATCLRSLSCNMIQRTLMMVSLLVGILLLPLQADARSSRGNTSQSYSHHTRSHSGASSYNRRATRTVRYAGGVKRGSRGRIARSQTAKNQFKKQHPCPSTGKSSGVCPGYVIDHVQALKRGGSDTPTNMQWQTTADAKAKDKWE
jgi:hypothetical protein